MRCLAAVAVTALVLGLSGTASALSVLGDPVEGNSWSQLFEETVGTLDHIQATMEPTQDYPPDPSWPSTAIYDFTNDSWSQSGNDGQLLLADGDEVGSLQFRLKFEGAKSTPFEFRWQTFAGGTAQNDVRVQWDGEDDWKSTTATGEWIDDFDESQQGVGGAGVEEKGTDDLVPEPLTMAGVLAGVAGIGAYVRRRRRA